jgi:hypothetical protein
MKAKPMPPLPNPFDEKLPSAGKMKFASIDVANEYIAYLEDKLKDRDWRLAECKKLVDSWRIEVAEHHFHCDECAILMAEDASQLADIVGPAYAPDGTKRDWTGE